MRTGKAMKRIGIGFFGLVAMVFFLLVMNNRIVAGRYRSVVTDSPSLTAEELAAAGAVYGFLEENGESILPGFHGKDIDLILYNEAYEFLFAREETGPEWELIGTGVLPGRNLYRRPAKDPQAFAVFVTDRWVGSMSTMDHFNKSMTEEVGPIFPPQLILLDETHYRGVVIHEMVHALQGMQNDSRLRSLSSLHDISKAYEEDDNFNDRILEEASSLDQAIRAEGTADTAQHVRLFLQERKERRAASGMSAQEVREEKDFEWLEGLARYAEFKSSEGSKSMVRTRMDRIEEKVRTRGDDRYYTLGMAQAMALDLLEEDWKAGVFESDFNLEDSLAELVQP